MIVIGSRSDYNSREKDDDNDLNEFRGLIIVPIRAKIYGQNIMHAQILTSTHVSILFLYIYICKNNILDDNFCGSA